MSAPAKKILAVSSGGGHWVQLQRLLPAFENHEVTFVTVNGVYRKEVPSSRFYVVQDATIWTKWGLVRLGFQMLKILFRERPDIVISTGAAPGYFALRFGKWLKARTIWVDSIANVEHLSLSGQKVGRYADLWLTQWPDLAGSEGDGQGPHYSGAVI